jgi:hypothetical protein
MAHERADCILFLDFDGVTHPDPCEVDQLFVNLPLIEEVLRQFKACKIVISSSWRVVHPLDEMREYFAADMQSRVIGVTPHASQGKETLDLVPSCERQWECEAWLRNEQVWLPQNRRLGAPWIAIDDRDDWFCPKCTNLLATNSRTAFTPNDGIRLEAMLRKRCHEQ